MSIQFNLNCKYIFNLFIWNFSRQYIFSSRLKDWRSTQNCFTVHWWTAIDALPRAGLGGSYEHNSNELLVLTQSADFLTIRATIVLWKVSTLVY
jgi:hypothetical protein